MLENRKDKKKILSCNVGRIMFSQNIFILFSCIIFDLIYKLSHHCGYWSYQYLSLFYSHEKLEGQLFPQFVLVFISKAKKENNSTCFNAHYIWLVRLPVPRHTATITPPCKKQHNTKTKSWLFETTSSTEKTHKFNSRIKLKYFSALTKKHEQVLNCVNV